MKGQTEQVDAILTAILRIEKKVDRLTTNSSLESKDYLSTREACSFLACQRTMLWKLVKDGKLTKLKLENGRTYYAAAELKKLIETPIENAA